MRPDSNMELLQSLSPYLTALGSLFVQLVTFILFFGGGLLVLLQVVGILAPLFGRKKNAATGPVAVTALLRELVQIARELVVVARELVKQREAGEDDGSVLNFDHRKDKGNIHAQDDKATVIVSQKDDEERIA